MFRGRRGNNRFTSFFMKQQVHFIAPKLKTILLPCSSCGGTGTDNYYLPCGECDGSGEKSFNISLYMYMGLAEVSGAHITSKGKEYSVRFFDMPNIPEMAKYEETRRFWRKVDTGEIPMSMAKWAGQVPENCLYTTESMAQNEAYDLNLDILRGFTTEQVNLILKLFDDSGTTMEPGSERQLPQELMGECPPLTFEKYSSSLSTPRMVTEDDYRRRHADVKIESVLT